MSYSSTSAAATSSCVESGFEAHSTTSAPPACNVRMRLAVSVVTCRHAAIRYPASGCSRSKRSRIAASTGICRSAHSIRRFPSPARARSFTSYRFVVAMDSFPRLRDFEKTFVLALLPLDPRQVVGAGEPAVDGLAERRLAPEPRREDQVGDLAVEPRPQIGQRAELVQLAQAVRAVAGGRPARHDEAEALEVAQHPRRPARPLCRLPHVQTGHEPNLTTDMSGFGRALPAVLVLEAHNVLEVRRRDLEDGCVLERRDPVDGAGAVAEARARAHDLAVQERLPGVAELALRATALYVPALLLLPMALDAQRLAGLHEEDLADVLLGDRPDQLPPPRLLDAPRLERPAVEPLEVR